MYYLDSLQVALDDQATNVGSNWTSQWETNYSFDFGLPGTYKLWLVMFKDTPPPLPYAPVRFDDLANTTAVQRISDSINDKIQSLNLSFVVRG